MRCRSLQSVRCAILALFGLGCLFIAVKNRWDQAKALRLEYERQVELRKVRGFASSKYDDMDVPPGQQACQHPHLPPMDADMLAMTWTAPTIVCSIHSDWVEVVGSKARISDAARNQFGPIECYFTAILRTDDDLSTVDGETTYTTTSYFFNESDFARVHCSAPDNQMWDGFVAGIRFDSALRQRARWDRVPASSLRLDVIVIGVHSMSRAMFLRTMPRTYARLTKTLGGTAMRGYNTVDEGIQAALLPMTTGRDEMELPEARRDRPGRVTEVDGFPFIWNDYKRAGYVTAFLEDSPDGSVFSDRLSGFKRQPTDHYLRPFYLAASKNYSEHHDFCLGAVPRHKVTLNYMKNFFNTYREHPKFLFAFFQELNGNNSFHLMGSADEDMADWLDEMKSSGHLDRTMIVLVSDHGRSFPENISTLQSKLEERMPFLAFVLPNWFVVSHSWEHDNLRSNVGRLTTAFDVHATLLAVLERPRIAAAGRDAEEERGMALFLEVPPERTCGRALVAPQWCACLRWGEGRNASGGEDLNGDPVVEMAKHALVNKINKVIMRYRSLCTPIRFKQLEWFRTLRPNPEVMPRNVTVPVKAVRKRALGGGEVPANVTDTHGVLFTTLSLWRQFCRLSVTTKPGDVTFEALIDYRAINNLLTPVTVDISRVDRGDTSARCAPRYAPPALAKVCVCRDYVKQKILVASVK